MAKVRLQVLPHQLDFINSRTTHTGLVGGFGCGKSIAATLKSIRMLIEYSANVAYYLPSYQLIKDIAEANFDYYLDMMGIEFQKNGSEKTYKTQFGTIFLRTLNRPELIVGYKVGYSVIDEADVIPQKKMDIAFKKIIARNRQEIGIQNIIDTVSTPEGFGWLYDFYVKNAKDSRKLIHGKTKDNPFLPDGYIKMLEDSYTEDELAAYLEGEFVNLNSGTVYRSFNRKINDSKRIIQKNDTLHIGMDFNITNMSATVRVHDGGNTIAVDEITDAYDTRELCEIIQDRYKGHKIIIYPDASGAARKTAAAGSDFDIIRKEFGYRIKAGKTNPSVNERVTIVNGSFLNSKKKSVNFVNVAKCPKLAEAYEKLAYDKNGRPDKNSGFDHITDADGYAICGMIGKRKTGGSYSASYYN